MEDFILSLDINMLKDLAFQLLNTVILCAVMSYLLYKPVKNFLAARRDRIEGQINSQRWVTCMRSHSQFCANHSQE